MGEFEIVMQTLDYVSGLYNFREFSQPHENLKLHNRCLRAGSLVWVGYRRQRSLILLAGFAGSRLFVAFGRDTLPNQVSLLVDYHNRVYLLSSKHTHSSMRARVLA